MRQRATSSLSAMQLARCLGAVLGGLAAQGGCKPAKDKALDEGAPPMTSRGAQGHAPISRSPQAPPAVSTTKSDTGTAVHDGTASGTCGSEMVDLGTYCIDRYEAHLVKVTASGVEVPHPHTERPAKGALYRARSAPRVFPQAYVNRVEAAAACDAAGKRLCTVKEWHAACTGSGRHVYPYGPQRRAGACNTGKLHLLSILFGRDPRAWSYDLHFNSPKLNAEPGYLARAGEYSACVTETGVYDLVGNLHEWVSDMVDPSLQAKVPLSDPLRRSLDRNRGHGVFMGGFYSTTAENGEGCNFLTPGHEPGYHDYSTGFRCCKDAASPVR